MTTTEPRYPKPPMRFPGLGRGHQNPPRRWILGHCDACTYPLAIAGKVNGAPWASTIVKQSDTDLAGLLEVSPGWPHSSPFVSKHNPANDPLNDPAVPSQPFDLTCSECGAVYPGMTRRALIAAAAPAVNAGASRWTVTPPAATS